jgi:hypothetical protein
MHSRTKINDRSHSSRPGSPVRTICWSGNKDKIPRKMTQHRVRTRSDVSTRLERIGPRLSDRWLIWQTRGLPVDLATFVNTSGSIAGPLRENCEKF